MHVGKCKDFDAHLVRTTDGNGTPSAANGNGTPLAAKIVTATEALRHDGYTQRRALDTHLVRTLHRDGRLAVAKLLIIIEALKYKEGMLCDVLTTHPPGSGTWDKSISTAPGDCVNGNEVALKTGIWL
jgi:hypothetical protein